MYKSLDDVTPDEWDASRKKVHWGGAAVDVHGIAKASAVQVGGSHYKKFAIQPAEFCHKNNIPYLEATAIKYLCRWRDKGGIQDLEKAKHFIDLLIEFENANTTGT
jgi:hypothetical protein